MDALYEEGQQRMYDEVGLQWAEDHAAELFEDAVDKFTGDRLSSYYLAHCDRFLLTPPASTRNL